jgi:hypothetical protein
MSNDKDTKIDASNRSFGSETVALFEGQELIKAVDVSRISVSPTDALKIHAGNPYTTVQVSQPAAPAQANATTATTGKPVEAPANENP